MSVVSITGSSYPDNFSTYCSIESIWEVCSSFSSCSIFNSGSASSSIPVIVSWGSGVNSNTEASWISSGSSRSITGSSSVSVVSSLKSKFVSLIDL